MYRFNHLNQSRNIIYTKIKKTQHRGESLRKSMSNIGLQYIDILLITINYFISLQFIAFMFCINLYQYFQNLSIQKFILHIDNDSKGTLFCLRAITISHRTHHSHGLCLQSPCTQLVACDHALVVTRDWYFTAILYYTMTFRYTTST